MKFDRFFELAKKAGIEEAEFSFSTTYSLSFSLFHGEIDSYSSNKSLSFYARGLYKGKMGSALGRRHCILSADAGFIQRRNIGLPAVQPVLRGCPYSYIGIGIRSPGQERQGAVSSRQDRSWYAGGRRRFCCNYRCIGRTDITYGPGRQVSEHT